MTIFSRMTFFYTCMGIALLSSMAFGINDEKKISQEARAIYMVGERPEDTVCIDLNGDMFPDIATSDKKQAISVLLNNKKGGYDVSLYKSLPHNTSIAAADVDGDGDIDLVPLTESMFGPIFLNNAHGVFTSSDITSQALTAMAGHIQTADFNKDSLPDFAITSSSDNILITYINEGNLKFKRNEFPLSGLGRNPFYMAARESVKSRLKKNAQEKEGGTQPSTSSPNNKESGQIATERKIQGLTVSPPERSAGTQPSTSSPNNKESGQIATERKIQGLTVSPPERSAERSGDSPSKPENTHQMEETGQANLPYLFASEGAIKRIGGIKHFLIADLNNDGYDDIVLPSYVLMRLYVGINDGKGGFSFTVIDLTADKRLMKEEHFSLSSIAAIRNGDKTVRFVAVLQENPGRIIVFRNDKGTLTYDNTVDMKHAPAVRMVAADFNDDGLDDIAVTFGAALPLNPKSPIEVYLQEKNGSFVLTLEDASDGYAAYINACRLTPDSKDYSLILSNIRENSLSILNMSSSAFARKKSVNATKSSDKTSH